MRVASLVVVLTACGGHSNPKPAGTANTAQPPPAPASRCEGAIAKSRPVLATMLAQPVTDDLVVSLVSMCKDAERRGNRAWLDCMDGANGDAAVKACFDEHPPGREAKRPSEAAIVLNKIAKNAKTEFMINAAFINGRVGPTPSKPCCASPHGTCPASAEWDQPVWNALEIQIDDDTQYQYTYESDGTSYFTATAIGDLDCDGKPSVWTMKGTIVDGNPRTTLVAPPPGVY